MPLNDTDLLREYATQKSERAFEELVRRHINFVYSFALRQTGHPHLAGEITQAVFIILAQKAGGIKNGVVLTGWLFNTVRFVAAAEFRSAARRRKYEQEACMESLTHEINPDADWQHIVPLLDECLAQLGEKDRQAVLLRFFEQKSFAEVGALLGTNADTATKRARRAVEKLRQLFLKRGVALSTVAIAGLLTANGIQAAPASLAITVAAASVVQGTVTASTATLIKGALKLMAWTKVKTTIVATAVILALGTATVTVTTLSGHASGNLPDGSFIRVLRVDYGTNFRYNTPNAKPWQQKLASRLPSVLASHLPGWMGGGGSIWMSSTPGTTNLAIFTASERPSVAVTKNLNYVERALVIFDKQGDESLAAMGGSTIASDDGKRYQSVQGWTVTAFPRRAKMLGARFIEKSLNTNVWKTVAEFQIVNPVFQNYPVWTPEPLPATQADGDFSATLTGLTTGLTLDNPEIIARLGDVPATRASFHSEVSGRPDPSWQPRSVTISDATGNKWTPEPPLMIASRAADTDELTFSGILWKGEATWKLRVEFSRQSGFDPDEIWTVRGINVPGPKQTINLSESTTIGTAALNLVAITGEKTKQPGDMEWIAKDGVVNISVRTKPWSEGERLTLVSASDERGRNVGIHPGVDWNNGNNVFGLEIPAGARKLDFKFALHKSKFVEFLARPEYASNKK